MKNKLANKPKTAELAAAIALSLAALSVAETAEAQSFNCAKATRTTEFAICNNETLIVLDETMASYHRQQLNALSTKPQRQVFSKTSKDWLRKRNACKGDFACLELRYKERIQALGQS